MKKIFLLLLFVCGLQGAFAQKSTQARKVLEATESAFEKGGGVSAQFTAASFSNGQSQGSTSGTMRIKGKKFQLKTDNIITWFDGKTQWSYLKQNDEVNVSTPTAAELQSMNPYAILGIYKKGYNYSMQEGTLRGKGVYTVHLTAQQKSNEIQEILLDVEKGSYTPYCIRFRQKNGTWTRIVVKNFKNKQKFSDSEFTFPKEAYPNAEVIDMR